MDKKNFALTGIVILFFLAGAGCSTVKKDTPNTSSQTTPQDTVVTQPTEETIKPSVTIPPTQKTETPTEKPIKDTSEIPPSTTLNTTVTCGNDAVCFKKHMTDCSNATHIYDTLIFKFTAKTQDKGSRCNINVTTKVHNDVEESTLDALDGTYYNCEFDKEAIKNNPDLYYQKTFEDASVKNCSGTYVDLMN